MVLTSTLRKAKRTDEEKVGLSIKVPISLKNEFDDVCRKNGVSMTTMILALMEVVVDEDKGLHQDIDAETLLKLNSDIKRLEQEIEEGYIINYDGERIPQVFKDGAPREIIEEVTRILHSKEAELLRLQAIFEAYRKEI